MATFTWGTFSSVYHLLSTTFQINRYTRSFLHRDPSSSSEKTGNLFHQASLAMSTGQFGWRREATSLRSLSQRSYSPTSAQHFIPIEDQDLGLLRLSTYPRPRHDSSQ
ncbi:dis1-suppressing protein kinase dsk1 [Fusarium fujikuroi]|nr:dis1-suppressing protein kinase dsk1 [Fusarium fujikuroi]